jgi:hypothetical protein
MKMKLPLARRLTVASLRCSAAQLRVAIGIEEDV